MAEDRIGPMTVEVCNGCRYLCGLRRRTDTEFRCWECKTGRTRSIVRGFGELLTPRPEWCQVIVAECERG